MYINTFLPYYAASIYVYVAAQKIKQHNGKKLIAYTTYNNNYFRLHTFCRYLYRNTKVALALVTLCMYYIGIR